MKPSFKHQVRVIFGDTDQMGVVYYANYLRYFESARAEFLRFLGRSNQDFERWGIALPVSEARVKYRRPARYEDLLDIELAIPWVRRVSMRFDYEVVRDGELLAAGHTVHACISPQGELRRIPAELLELIGQGSLARGMTPEGTT